MTFSSQLEKVCNGKVVHLIIGKFIIESMSMIYLSDLI